MNKQNIAKENKENSSEILSVCFVIMPVSDPDSYEKGHFKNIYENIFKPACVMAGYQAIRADEVAQTNLIHLDILRKLLDAPIVICDLSSRNPNTMFELGIRQAFDKPVVLVQEENTPAIFDISPLRYTTYRNRQIYHEVLEDQRKIADAIKATSDNGENDINSIVRLLSLTQPAQLSQISESERESGLLKTILAEVNSLKTELKQSKIRLDISTLEERANHLLSRIDNDRQNGITERISTYRIELSTLSRYIENFVPINSQESFQLQSLLQSLRKVYLQTISKLLQELENPEREVYKSIATDDDIPF